MQAHNVNITLPGSHAVESREISVKVDVTKLSHEVIAKLALHGLTQKVADAAASAGGLACEQHFGAGWKEVNKADRAAWLKTPAGIAKAGEFAKTAMQTVVEALYAGDWSTRGESGGTAPVDPVANLAHSNAKTDLLAKFKQMTGKRKMVDIAKTGPSLAKYFVIKDDSAVWQESEVAAYIARMAESGKRDYMAEARVALDDAPEVDDLI